MADNYSISENPGAKSVDRNLLTDEQVYFLPQPTSKLSKFWGQQGCQNQMKYARLCVQGMNRILVKIEDMKHKISPVKLYEMASQERLDIAEKLQFPQCFQVYGKPITDPTSCLIDTFLLNNGVWDESIPFASDYFRMLKKKILDAQITENPFGKQYRIKNAGFKDDFHFLDKKTTQKLYDENTLVAFSTAIDGNSEMIQVSMASPNKIWRRISIRRYPSTSQNPEIFKLYHMSQNDMKQDSAAHIQNVIDEIYSMDVADHKLFLIKKIAELSLLLFHSAHFERGSQTINLMILGAIIKSLGYQLKPRSWTLEPFIEADFIPFQEYIQRFVNDGGHVKM